ncbi:respiratory nitrate reductase subunit gamma [bacterium]|nr:respiratory nitrate reductase subunit gamma [bacterium]MBU1152761.1 respiratory nitrate reductase subunit gamma [bacterium]MBU2600517.1 respiratory nitrate reductase subunit gamma [bacterium]
MNPLTVFYTIFTYIAIAIFILGFLTKIWKYGATPSPLKIPTTPAPTTAFGAGIRVACEALFFRSLFKGNKFIWLGGAVLHASLLVILISHTRYFIHPVPECLMYFQVFFQNIGHYAGYILLLAIGYLGLRRIFIDQTAYISILADYFILALIFCIGASGVLLKYITRPDLVSVKAFTLGLISFKPEAVPTNPIFLIHLTLILILLIYFPFSKLMHAGGIFFSPTRHQVDNSREKRHVNPWD